MSLLDDLNIEYQQWRPADNPDQPQGIEGLVKDRQLWESNFGVFDVIFIVDDQGDAWSWAALGAIATREVGRRNPLPGDRIGVAYKGTVHDDKYGKDMNVFRVLTKPGPAHAPGSGYVAPTAMPVPTGQQTFETEEPPF